TTPYTVTRSYLPGTNVLQTRFETEGGVLVLTDCLPVRRQPEGASGGEDTVRPHPYHQVLRFVTCEAGEVSVGVTFVPRFDYGLTIPRFEPVSDHLGLVFGGADALLFQSEIPILHCDEHACRYEGRLRQGDRARLVVTYGLPHELRPHTFSAEEVEQRLAATRDFWEKWTSRCTYEGPYRDAVVRSALVLKALTNAPTGALVAAPTTSLPEEIGGVRNWDYRYTWLRDASLALQALFELGYVEEAAGFHEYLWRTTAGRAEDLQIMYGLGGERLLPEVALDHLDGYRGSRPVRIGNAASEQFQLDIPGEMLELAWEHHQHGGAIEPGFWRFLTGIVAFVADNWARPDSGLWEVRGERLHFVHSKVMCWVAVDRAIRLARARGAPAPLAAWERLRGAIRRRVEEEGVDPDTGAFVRSFGTRVLDASCLLIPIVGFLPPRDARVRATIEQIERRLVKDGLVHRYRTDDGLPGGEGAFLICSLWLVECLALAGEVERARERFEHLLGFANDVGLLSEEVDPASGALLGNFPQGFSHLGLIEAAATLNAPHTPFREGARR